MDHSPVNVEPSTQTIGCSALWVSVFRDDGALDAVKYSSFPVARRPADHLIRHVFTWNKKDSVNIVFRCLRVSRLIKRQRGTAFHSLKRLLKGGSLSLLKG